MQKNKIDNTLRKFNSVQLQKYYFKSQKCEKAFSD